jgi:hypothetical protein
VTHRGPQLQVPPLSAQPQGCCQPPPPQAVPASAPLQKTHPAGVGPGAGVGPNRAPHASVGRAAVWPRPEPAGVRVRVEVAAAAAAAEAGAVRVEPARAAEAAAAAAQQAAAGGRARGGRGGRGLGQQHAVDAVYHAACHVHVGQPDCGGPPRRACLGRDGALEHGRGARRAARGRVGAGRDGDVAPAPVARGLGWGGGCWGGVRAAGAAG